MKSEVNVILNSKEKTQKKTRKSWALYWKRNKTKRNAFDQMIDEPFVIQWDNWNYTDTVHLWIVSLNSPRFHVEVRECQNRIEPPKQKQRKKNTKTDICFTWFKILFKSYCIDAYMNISHRMNGRQKQQLSKNTKEKVILFG